jgi:succinoglycan biosynthesis transport protein ExoP
VEEKRRLSLAAGKWLQTRLDELSQQVAVSRRKTIEFRNKVSIVDVEGERNISRQIVNLNDQSSKLKTHTREIKAKLNQILAILKTFREKGPKVSVPASFMSPLIAKLKEEALETSNQEAEWTEKYGRFHSAVIKLHKKKREINAALLAEYKHIAENYRSELEIANKQQNAIQQELAKKASELERVQKAQIKLRELESETQASQKLYEIFLARQSEIPNQDTLPVSDMRIIQEATTPILRSYNKTMKVAMLIVLAGCALGFGAAVFRELTDGTFRRISEVAQTFNKELLGVVPLVRSDELRRTYKGLQQVERTEGDQTIPHHFSLIWTSYYAPENQYASNIRAIRLRLDRQIKSLSCRVVGVTSTLPSEGASTIAASLAVSMASAGVKTLLLDCDLRNSLLSRELAPTAEIGLVDVIQDKVKLLDALWHDPASGLSFLPACSSPGIQADELLGSYAMMKLIECVRKDYDYIIVDLPPLIPMVDVQMMHDLIVSYVFVVKWGATSKETVRSAFAQVPDFDKKIAGVVLNQVDLSRLSLYDQETAQWFDRKRYSNYLHGLMA